MRRFLQREVLPAWILSRPALLAWLSTTPAIAGLGWGVWATWFVCDDAYISFRYARNLLEGRGLVFNPGEWVEGYTNFLWVIQVAALWALGVSPERSSVAMSLGWTAIAVALVGLWAAQTREAARPFVLATAVALYATERSVAGWATGGLETRQFTVLVCGGLFLLARPGHRAAAWASALLGLAVLTRPEALLVFAVAAAARAFDSRALRGRARWREALAMGLPFGGMALGHLALRGYLYGQPLPNTFYAKGVAWTEMGLRYLAVATLESGLYLFVPLAVAGAAARARRTGRLTELAGVGAMVAYLPFLIQVGGDHFEWRPFDWWWPLLAVYAAEALWLGPRWLALGALPVALLYGRALEVAHEVQLRTGPGTPRMHIELNRRDLPWLGWIPGLGSVLPWYNREARELVQHQAGTRLHIHQSFAAVQHREYDAYLGRRAAIPPGAVTIRASVGILPFDLPDVVVIDRHGLTDATIARTPVSGKQRFLAHDREPPRGCAAARGVNTVIEGAVGEVAVALRLANYALPLGEGVFMPASAGAAGPGWLDAAAASLGPVYRRGSSLDDPAGNELQLGAVRWTGVEILGAFEEDLGAWTGSGSAFGLQLLEQDAHRGVAGGIGAHAATSRAGGDDLATGTLTSPPFVLPPDALIALFIARTTGDGVGVRIRIDGEPPLLLTGARGTELGYVWADLARYAGRTAVIEGFDETPHGYVAFDQVVLLISGSASP